MSATAPVTTEDRVTASRTSPSSIAFWSLLAVGFALRIVFLFSTDFRMNSDHAIVYLMAKQVGEGEFPTFFWGQSYGGTFLSLLAGVVMLLTGPSIVVLAIVTAVVWAGAAVVFRNFVRIALGTRAGNLAGILFWFPGGTILGTSLVDPGFYGPSLLFGLGAALLSVATRTDRSIRVWIGLGVFAGLSLWTSPIAIAFAAPAVIYAMATDRRWRRWIVGAAAAAIAALPWFIETLMSRFSSVQPIGGAERFHPESFASIFTSMFSAAFPGATYELMQFAVAVATVVAIGALIYRAITRRNAGAIILSASTILAIVVIVVGTGVRLNGDSVRYSAFLIPALSMSVAWLVSRRPFIALATALVAVVVTISMVFVRQDGFALMSPRPFDQALTQVDEFLDAQGVEAAYGSYWAAYALTAESNEEPTVASFLPNRYEPYVSDARGDVPMAIVVFAGNENDKAISERQPVAPRSRTVFGQYAVYLYDTWFDPYTLELGLN